MLRLKVIPPMVPAMPTTVVPSLMIAMVCFFARTPRHLGEWRGVCAVYLEPGFADRLGGDDGAVDALRAAEKAGRGVVGEGHDGYAHADREGSENGFDEGLAVER